MKDFNLTRKELSLCHKLIFSNSLIFCNYNVTLDIMNSVGSSNLSLKHQRFTLPGCIDIGIMENHNLWQNSIIFINVLQTSMSHERGYNSCLLHNGSIHTDVGHHSSHNSSMPQGFQKPQFSGGRNGTWSGCPAHSCSSHPASRQVYHLWHLNQIFQFFYVSSPIHSGANRPTYTQWNVTVYFLSFSQFSLLQKSKRNF